MKTRIITLLIAAALCFSFTACAVKNVNENDVPEEKTEEKAEKPEKEKSGDKEKEPEKPAEPDKTSEPEKPAEPEKQEEVKAPARIELEKTNLPSEAAFTSAVKAYGEDGELLWTYDAGKHYIAQLDNLQEIGLRPEGYLFIADGTIYCLKTEGEGAGTLLWKNEEFKGASAYWTYDEDGALYITGYFGPDLMIIDKDGNTLARCGSFDDDYYWACGVELTEDGPLISYENRFEKLLVDPYNGTVIEKIEPDLGEPLADVDWYDQRYPNLSYCKGEWQLNCAEVEGWRWYPDEMNVECTLEISENGLVSFHYSEDDLKYDFEDMPATVVMGEVLYGMDQQDGYYTLSPFVVEKPEEDYCSWSLSFEGSDEHHFTANLVDPYVIEIIWYQSMGGNYPGTLWMKFDNSEWLQYNRDKLALKS